jgi:hypothetical protein
MGYVLRTEALGKTYWFAGAYDAPLTPNVSITQMIFSAWVFEGEEEAQALIDSALGNVWSISFVDQIHTSKNLSSIMNDEDEQKPSRPTFEDDLNIIAVRDEYGSCWTRRDNVRGGKLERSEIIHLMRGANEALELARRAWTRLYGGKRAKKEMEANIAARISLGVETADWEVREGGLANG